MSTKKTTKKTTSKKTTASKPKQATAKRQKPASKPAAATKVKGLASDKSRPATGSVLHRSYKGKDLEVRVLADGFEFEGESFSSLSALAKHITGYPAISGPVFFKLASPKAETK